MKKLICSMAIVSVFLLFALSGCTYDFDFKECKYQSGNKLIENISIQVSDREVEICASEDNQVHIDYFDGNKERLNISISENNDLTVKLVFEKQWTDFIGSKPSKKYRKIKIRIPNNTISVLTVETTNADIKISSVSLKSNLSLNTNGGNIIFERLSAGEAINLFAKNGNITGGIIGSWDDFAIACEIKKGNCNLPLNKEGGNKSLFVKCNNGNINIEFIK